MYIECMALENLILFTFITVIYTSFLNIHMTKLKVASLVLFITSFSLVIKIFCGNSVILTFILNVFYIYFVDKTQNLKTYIKRIIYYFIIFYLYIGFIFFFTLVFSIDASSFFRRCMLYSFFGLLLEFSINILWKMWIKKIKNSDNYYIIEIFDKVNFHMFLDTGNFATFKGLPVIIINEQKYLRKIKKYRRNISSTKSYSITLKTISGKKEYKGYIFENVNIRKKGDDLNKNIDKVFITFTNEKIEENVFDGILPFSIFIEK